MSNLYYDREAEEIERQIVFVVSKVFLIVVGLLFIIVPSLDPNVTHLRVWQVFGLLCVTSTVVWICTEKRVMTPREELESLLIEAAKRYARAGSIARLVEEYKARGADDLTLSRLRGAPRLLRERAEDKLSLGLIFSGLGTLVLFIRCS